MVNKIVGLFFTKLVDIGSAELLRSLDQSVCAEESGGTSKTNIANLTFECSSQ